MKVLNLQCQHAHAFEGWFASEEDFQTQLASGLVQCPVCADSRIDKMPSAPRLNLHAGGEPPQQPQKPEEKLSQVQAQFMSMVRQLVEKTEDVGERFTDEARKMHYGEIEQRNIRGRASMAEAAELIEEGIEVMPLPLTENLKNTLQ